jgi:ribonuclease-3
VSAASLPDLAERLGHDFADPQLLREALTHRGATGLPGAPPHGYERLEFLGDRVLALVIAEMLLAEYPEEAEGPLARRLTGLVRREALERVAADLDLGRHLMLAQSEERAGARANTGIQADACEAIIGALFLDGGLEVARRFVERLWRPLLADHGGARRDAKTELQEWAQARGLSLPEYIEAAREGPAHEPSFTIEVRIEGHAPARARGASKRMAEQAAAAAMLARVSGGGDD